MSPLNKEGLKAYESLDSYSPFALGWVKEVKITVFFKPPVEITLVIGRFST